jgi:hypothetical protein
MRFVFILALIINVALLAFDQGFFGVSPSERGREVRPFAQRNQQAIDLGRPLPTQRL